MGAGLENLMRMHMDDIELLFKVYSMRPFILYFYPFVAIILGETMAAPLVISGRWIASWLLPFIIAFIGYILLPWFRSNKSYLFWLSVAVLYHLPPPPGDTFMKVKVSVFLTTFACTILLVFFFLVIYHGLRYFLTREALTAPDVQKFLKHCTSLRYHIFMSWPAFVTLNIYVYYYYRTIESNSGDSEKPKFLDMVPWYSGTSADLYKTVFDLLISVKIFLGRFDLRILQGGMNQTVLLQDQEKWSIHFSRSKEELWFDFMADTGDGGNSTYAVARLLAKPELCFDTMFVETDDDGRNISSTDTDTDTDTVDEPDMSLTLKRGELLLIGGDLAYPNPSKSTYEKRLLCPFEDALQPPSNREDPDPERFGGEPKCYVIPGNHDWFDGLRTFTKYICEKSWLGGWFMPQKMSYFHLKLPNGWWIFGLDLALDDDIDIYQFQYFSQLASSKEMKKDDCVIVMTHQPDWLVDWYESRTDVDRDNLVELICNILKERCKLRIAGDIHHYMRHQMVESNDSVYPQHLLVNGCGGAFLHPTHVFDDFQESHGVSYKCRASYPDNKTSRKLGFKNISNFRKVNSQFDLVGGILYFMLVFSMFPRCKLHQVIEEYSKSGFLRICFRTLCNTFIDMLQHSYVSLGVAMLFLIVAIAFAPSKLSWKKRAAIGLLHVSAHLTAAVVLMLLLESVVVLLVHHKLLRTSGYHSLFQWYESEEESKYFGLINAYMKNLMFAFDVPEIMAVTRSNICNSGMASLSRLDTILYYGSVFLYFWLLSTSAVSKVFGIYLYICVNWFNLHYDEAFSSLRIADYKAFTRFHITTDGDLEVFTLAIDKVPKEWERDPRWNEESSDNPSYLREFPSKWMAADLGQDPLHTVRIIDQFVIRKEDKPNINETGSSQK
ncbi:hypothetical protein I3842_16G045700 [Carya illinoinensis]|uniref:Calcineurin-like phosphoesterase domain-containing protein n=1 Tax=Carya illinoinensis TaxID=32201 RepID=A0A922A015_CARIL|nr:hypothetical protein I3842_16G045700 [Carya illinoinensis]